MPQAPDADAGEHQLGAAHAPGVAYNPFYSGSPRPACEDDRLLDEEVIAAVLALHVPRDKLQSLLQVVCRVFGVQATVIVLFGDRRAHVLNCISHLGHQEGGVPWRWGQCGWMMSSEAHQLLVVDDMLDDAR